MKFEDIQIGNTASLRRNICPCDVNIFTELSGDTNSVHRGPAGIVHGILLCSFISTLIGTMLPGNGSVWKSVDIKFIEPAKVGDVLTVIGEVIKKENDGNLIWMNIDIYNQNDVFLVASKCIIKLLE